MSIKQNLIGGFIVVSVLFLSKLCFFCATVFQIMLDHSVGSSNDKSFSDIIPSWRKNSEPEETSYSTEAPAPFYTCNQSASDG